MIKFKIDDRAFKKTLRQYSKVSSLKLGEIIEKRGTRLAIKLMQAYKDKAPSQEKIRNLVSTLGGRVKVRARIAKKNAKQSTKVKREIAARVSAINYTALGWLYAAKMAGLPIRKQIPAKFGKTTMGDGKSKLTGNRPYVVIENFLYGASILDKKSKIINSVLKAETKDMQVYIQRKTLKKHTRKFK